MTDAAIPWFTGTSLNPLWRAIYLKKNGYDVTLYLPWVTKEGQAEIFPRDISFDCKEDHYTYILQWIPVEFQKYIPEIQLYDAHYTFRCIFPKGKLRDIIKPCDILILEEPEHLLFFQIFNNWHTITKHVVGICHTNYHEYFTENTPRFLKGISKKIIIFVANYIIKKNCDLVIRLSNSLPVYTKSIVENIHGVSDLNFTIKYSENYPKIAYFMSKFVWTKGFKPLIDLCQSANFNELDIYGGGPDKESIINYSHSKGVKFNFHDILTNQNELAPYKIFINPSLSEGLCTATAEAFAMGKFVILPLHPSNEFFYQFKNSLIYEDTKSFKAVLKYALENEPHKEDSQLKELSWDSATHRLLKILNTLDCASGK